MTAQIDAIWNAHAEVRKEIELAVKSKAEAKAKYESCLDEGDESGMKKCLATIRQSNTRIEELKVEFKNFPPKVEMLRDQHT